jgi:hypothetical protein
MKRPFGITLIAIYAAIAGVLAAVVCLQWLGLFPWLGPGPSVRTFDLWYALMYGLLAWVYLWLFQMLWAVQQAGWVFCVVIILWDLTLAVLALLGVGGTPTVVAGKMLLASLILIYLFLPGTRRAFAQSTASTPA